MNQLEIDYQDAVDGYTLMWEHGVISEESLNRILESCYKQYKEEIGGNKC